MGSIYYILSLLIGWTFVSTITSFHLRSSSISNNLHQQYGHQRLLLQMASKGGSFDYDLIIVGCGVGGHGAALHARANGLKTAVLTGKDVGGTCVNRGCVPSKALLAASGRIREMKDAHHLKSFGISVKDVQFDRAGVANHANQLANRVKLNLEASLRAQGVDIIESMGQVTNQPHEIKLAENGNIITAQDIILAPGSVPFVPKGIQADEKTVFTSDGGLKLEFIPQYIAIIGSGYIGLEFSDVYTALGSEVTFIEAMDTLMPTFDPEIRRLADRLLIKPRAIDSRTGVFASEVIPGIPGVKPVSIKMIDAKTKVYKETLEVDACMVATGRAPNTAPLNLAAAGIETDRGGFIAVDAHMQVLSSPVHPEKPPPLLIPHLYCIGDANGKMMLAHAASTQGISAVENILYHRSTRKTTKSANAKEDKDTKKNAKVHAPHVVNHEHIPAACFTHPEIAMVGLSEEQAKQRSQVEHFTLGKSVGHFRANSKALAENEGDGIAKVLFKEETGEVLGVHIIGLHAADLIQECANAMMAGTTVQELAMMTHTHPTLSEVLDAAFKGAVGMSSH